MSDFSLVSGCVWAAWRGVVVTLAPAFVSIAEAPLLTTSIPLLDTCTVLADNAFAHLIEDTFQA